MWLHVTVTGEDGHIVTGLGRDQFVIEEDGREVRMADFVKDEHPVAIALMLDISGSMIRALPDVARAAESLVAHFIPGDRVNIGTFSSKIMYSSRFTANPRIIQQGIKDAMFGGERECDLMPPDKKTLVKPGGTWMWDAIECGVRVAQTDREAFRRVLVLVTDGKTNGGFSTQSAAQNVAIEAGVLIYATGLRGIQGLDSPLLTNVTKATGGWYTPLKEGDDYTPVFKRIGGELHNQYVMAFLTTATTNLPVVVRVKDPTFKVRTVRGRNVTPR